MSVETAAGNMRKLRVSRDSNQGSGSPKGMIAGEMSCDGFILNPKPCPDLVHYKIFILIQAIKE